MEIVVDSHTLERAQERGTTAEEIKEVIETGFPIPAKYARMGKAKIFPFSQIRLGTYYEQKRVEVFYISQRDIIVTVPFTYFMAAGRFDMEILYNSKTDLLYLRLDDRKQEVLNKRISDDIVIDIGDDNRIRGN